MSISSALYTGVTGLLNNGESMNVIGNNLANVNTVGFKGGRTLFSDMLSASIGNNSQIGRGMQIQKIENLFTQSGFQTSEKVTDLALQGNSFFALGNPSGNLQVTSQSNAFLTRAGDFRVDRNLNLVNPDGYQVLDTQGNPIKFSDNAAAISTAAATFSTSGTVAPAIAALTADNTLAQTAVTAMPAGAAKTAAQALVTAAAAQITNLTTANATMTASPTAETARNTNAAVVAAFAAVQAAQAAAGSALNSSDEVTTVYDAYAKVATEQGKAFAKITQVDPNGLITYLGQDGITQMYYNTTGQVGVANTQANAATVQRIAVVNVSDTSGLEKVAGTLFKATGASGVPLLGFTMAGNSANATTEKILSNSLEMSNVDMASEFVKMITTQRAYSANSKTITTTDEMMQEVLNLKR